MQVRNRISQSIRNGIRGDNQQANVAVNIQVTCIIDSILFQVQVLVKLVQSPYSASNIT